MGPERMMVVFCDEVAIRLAQEAAKEGMQSPSTASSSTFAGIA